ncbi:NAD-dependent epimerase/dehydratase family protein [Streptomyces sp. NPDC005012]|uniref:NAD-dependent epimerase/dehydratase family protein n=1 Tax=Streptomyces sp. NPDC005012 TaxID=3154558 RepID=UPI0033A8AF5D
MRPASPRVPVLSRDRRSPDRQVSPGGGPRRTPWCPDRHGEESEHAHSGDGRDGTGGAGPAAAPAGARGDRVRVLARDEARAAAWAGRGAEVVRGDLRDTDVLTKAVDGVDAVLNVAAAFKGGSDPREITEVNRDAAVRLGRLARDSGAHRFVQVSTNLVYGAGRDRPHEEDDDCVPGGPLRGPYPASKAEAERELLALDGLDVRIGRLAFVYGDGDPYLTDALRWTRHRPAAGRLQLVHVADAACARSP